MEKVPGEAWTWGGNYRDDTAAGPALPCRPLHSQDSIRTLRMLSLRACKMTPEFPIGPSLESVSPKSNRLGFWPSAQFPTERGHTVSKPLKTEQLPGSPGKPRRQEEHPHHRLTCPRARLPSKIQAAETSAAPSDLSHFLSALRAQRGRAGKEQQAPFREQSLGQDLPTT